MIKVSMPRLEVRPEEAAITKRFCEIAMRTQKVVLTAPLRINIRKTTCGNDLGVCFDETEVHLNDNLLYGNAYQYFTTLAHELIHVKQRYNGTLKKWFAETAVGTPYRERPWEIEAFREQGHLAFSVCSQMVAERKELSLGWGCHSGNLGSAFKYVSAYPHEERRFQTFARFCIV